MQFAKVEDTGEDLFLKFAQERFVIDDSTERPQKGFYEPVQKSKIKTMSKSVAVAPSKSKGVPVDGVEMYLKLLSINTFKKVSLERVMSFENSTVLLSLFTDDGMMSTTKKSDFMGKLEDLNYFTRSAVLKASCLMEWL